MQLKFLELHVRSNSLCSASSYAIDDSNLPEPLPGLQAQSNSASHQSTGLAVSTRSINLCARLGQGQAAQFVAKSVRLHASRPALQALVAPGARTSSQGCDGIIIQALRPRCRAVGLLGTEESGHVSASCLVRRKAVSDSGQQPDSTAVGRTAHRTPHGPDGRPAICLRTSAVRVHSSRLTRTNALTCASKSDPT